MGRLQDQVAIVTGGATGLGGATARRLAREGARVLIADIDPDTAGQNAARIRAEGGVAEVLRTDVGRHDDVKAMIEHAVERWGRLDILVNNAYPATRAPHGGAVETTEEEWDHGMAVLVKSIFLGVKYAVPEMRKAGGGSIVNMASVHGLLQAAGWLVYEAGKSAVIGITKQMAIDYGPDRIRVNAICPGHIVTESLQAQVWDGNPSGLKLFENQYPLRRLGRPDEIAGVVAFLCSDDASFVTGHALVVDGGLSIQLQENLGVRQAGYMQQHPDTTLPD